MKHKLLYFSLIIFYFFSSHLSAKETIKTGQFEVEIAQSPAWVNVFENQKLFANDKKKSSSDGIHFLISDNQINLRNKQPEIYIRQAVVISNQQAMTEFGEFKTSYSTSFNSITLHHIVIYRNGAKLDRLDKKAIKIIAEEKDWDQRILKDYAQIVLPIQDLRLGDVLDVAYTVKGDNPIFGSKSRFSLDQQFGANTDYLRGRVLTKRSRPQLTIKTFYGAVLPTEKSNGDELEYAFELSDVKAYIPEKDTPYWGKTEPFVQFSEYKNWSEVVEWGNGLFNNNEKSVKVSEIATQLKSKATTSQEAVALALNFVQNDIRYLSMSIGSYAYQPKAPDTVLSDRFGDCKDKTNLFISIVRSMGFEASPVLVSTLARQTAIERLPGPQLFDHVIASVVIDEVTYWLDSTATYQPISLTAGSLGIYDYGLILKSGGNELTKLNINHSEKNKLVLEQEFNIQDFNQPIALNLKLKSVGQFAVVAKKLNAAGQLEQFNDFLINSLNRVYPSIKFTKTPTFSENVATGEVLISMYAIIADALIFEKQRPPTFLLQQPFVNDLLKLNVNHNRTTPVYIGTPMKSLQIDTFNLKHPIVKLQNPISDVIDDENFSYFKKIDATEYQITVQHGLTVFTDFLMPSKIQKNIENRNKAVSKSIAYISFPEISTRDFVKNEQVNFKKDFPTQSPALFSKLLERNYSDDSIYLERLLNRYAYNPSSKIELLKTVAKAKADSNQLDLAISYIDKALLLDSNRSDLLLRKGMYLTSKGALIEGIRFLELAHSMGERDSELNRFLGYAYYYSGNYLMAIKSFEEKIKGESTNDEKIFPLIWIKLATLKGNLDFSKYEVAHASILSDDKSFSASILNFLLGRITEAQFIYASKSTSASVEWRNSSELYFYIAQKALSENKKSIAVEALNKVLQINVVNFIETSFAKVELAMLNAR